MQLAGHILRLPRQRHSKTAMTWVPPGGRRKRGRPKNTWRRTFQEDIKRADITWEEAEEAAATRPRWKLAAQCADLRFKSLTKASGYYLKRADQVVPTVKAVHPIFPGAKRAEARIKTSQSGGKRSIDPPGR
ncbi:hypothetical protein Bbelb_357640 [Branchiostoma belcheri]|nr:hypothetical protein Bbelb_357640 [Branchiostoma belcheri]